MFKLRKRSVAAIVGVLALLLIGGGEMYTRQVGSPSYTVLSKANGIEIRRYDPRVVAEVLVTGERKEAIRKGFRILADYIFGNNDKNQEVAMMKPVMQQPVYKLPHGLTMTLSDPHAGKKKETHGEQAWHENQWMVQFVMPTFSDPALLPRPHSPLVTLKRIEEKDYAVVQFSGQAEEKLLQEKLSLLQEAMKNMGLKAEDKPVIGFYNPPWTLWFLRRNEIMIEIPPYAGDPDS